MEPPKTPAQLAAQKYEIVETFQDIAEKGIGEAFPILALVTNGKAPDADEPSKQDARVRAGGRLSVLRVTPCIRATFRYEKSS